MLKREKVVAFVVTVAVACLMGACQAPKTKQVIINSEPQGAVVLIDGEVVGQTPLKRDITYKDPKKERHLIQIRKDGFRTMERYIMYRDEENILFQLERLD